LFLNILKNVWRFALFQKIGQERDPVSGNPAPV